MVFIVRDGGQRWWADLMEANSVVSLGSSGYITEQIRQILILPVCHRRAQAPWLDMTTKSLAIV